MQHMIEFLTLLLPLVGAATISKRGVDRGTFKLECKGGEGACNNAAFYINCISGGDNTITYLGVDPTQNEKNRVESGCRADIVQEGANGALTRSSTSVCQQFPYSMQFIPDPDRLSQTAAENYQCDEWPPASAEQPAYDKKTHPNSLRCMKASENGKLGTLLGNIYKGNIANTAGKKDKMAAGDYFKVDFDTTGADLTKLKYVKSGTTAVDCTNDGFQFQMTKRPNNGGLISPGAPSANDNEYTLWSRQGNNKPVGMCSIDITRENDNSFTHICVTDETNTDCAVGGTATLAKTPESHAAKGLKQGDVTFTKTGAMGSKLEFKFGDITWDTDSKGTGKGPGGSQNEGTHTWCRNIPTRVSTTKGARDYQCYFPC